MACWKGRSAERFAVGSGSFPTFAKPQGMTLLVSKKA